MSSSAAAASRKWGVLLLTVGFVAGCDLVNQYTQTQETPEYALSLTVDPTPLVANQAMNLYATLRKDRRGVTGCRVRFAPVRAGAAAPGDNAWGMLEEQSASGVYRTRALRFGEAGDWDVHVAIRCSGAERTLVFPLHIASSGR
jgi:hypothetical protein